MAARPVGAPFDAHHVHPYPTIRSLSLTTSDRLELSFLRGFDQALAICAKLGSFELQAVDDVVARRGSTDGVAARISSPLNRCDRRLLLRLRFNGSN